VIHPMWGWIIGVGLITLVVAICELLRDKRKVYDWKKDGI
jgi:hypothetical protein